MNLRDSPLSKTPPKIDFDVMPKVTGLDLLRKDQVFRSNVRRDVAVAADANNNAAANDSANLDDVQKQEKGKGMITSRHELVELKHSFFLQVLPCFLNLRWNCDSTNKPPQTLTHTQTHKLTLNCSQNKQKVWILCCLFLCTGMFGSKSGLLFFSIVLPTHPFNTKHLRIHSFCILLLFCCTPFFSREDI